MLFSTLRDFLNELQNSGKWTPDEIKTVEEAGARALAAS